MREQEFVTTSGDTFLCVRKSGITTFTTIRLTSHRATFSEPVPQSDTLSGQSRDSLTAAFNSVCLGGFVLKKDFTVEVKEAHDESRSQGAGLRKFLSLEFAFTLLFFAGIGHAQETQVDVAGGGNILWSPQNNTASEAFLPPAEKGGVYPSGFFQYLNKRDRGINVEGAFRYHQGLYNNFQYYRPILIDVNGVYSHRLAAKTHGDLMAGAGMSLCSSTERALALSAPEAAAPISTAIIFSSMRDSPFATMLGAICSCVPRRITTSS